uniref:Putative secreted protein n=1 Tax=Anopheles triannulatus TaxID=58253 RepID=A0A2M4B0Q3_9DIPT
MVAAIALPAAAAAVAVRLAAWPADTAMRPTAIATDGRWVSEPGYVDEPSSSATVARAAVVITKGGSFASAAVTSCVERCRSVEWSYRSPCVAAAVAVVAVAAAAGHGTGFPWQETRSASASDGARGPSGRRWTVRRHRINASGTGTVDAPRLRRRSGSSGTTLACCAAARCRESR